MIKPVRTTFINRSPDLDAFCESIPQNSAIGVDTEFVRERTYYPIFCLLQISTNDRVALIDPLELTSLDSLKRVLANPRILKILHSGRQDIEVLYQALGVLPSNLVDTQVAASLIGYPDQIGYGRLVNDLFSIELGKEHTRTDWQQRPLSPDQLRYAADDVAYLPPAFKKLHTQLSTLGRADWVTEDSYALLDPTLYQNLPEFAWKRLSGTHDIPTDLLHRVKGLAAWREETAQQLNLPRNWIIKDEDIHSLARMSRIDPMSIPRMRGLDHREQHRLNLEITRLRPHADDIAGQRIPDRANRPLPPDPRRKALLKDLSQIVLVTAQNLSVSPGSLASRRDLELLLDNPGISRLTKGWRLSIIGERLLERLPTHPGATSAS